MPPKGFGEKCHTLYFPSKEMLISWREKAHLAKIPLTKWIIAIVENSLESPDEELPASHDIQALRQENLRLRKENATLQQSLSARETELFKLKYAPAKNSAGILELDSRLIAILQDGCTWSQRDILEALDVNAHDVDALQAVTALMQRLQDAGVVAEEKRGWRWKK